jgi:hypothetical protein
MRQWNPVHTILLRLSERARQERGAVLVEFALILPVLILIILGILYFGRYMDYSNQLTQLAETGARWAAVNNNPGSPSTLQSYIKSQAQSELASGSSDVTAASVYIYYPTGSSNAVGNALRVCLSSTFKYPFLGIGSTSQNVAEYATMRIEVADGNGGTTAFTADSTSSLPSGCARS